MNIPTIRTTKTASGAIAVQVVKYNKGKTQIFKHIGSAHTRDELAVLQEAAESVIKGMIGQGSLFSECEPRTLSLAHALYLGATHVFARTILLKCADICGLKFLAPVIRDFAIMRIIEPASKLRTFELMERYFNVSYSKRAYDILARAIEQKAKIERAAVSCARKTLKEGLSLILYDVTTLYFETFKGDELRIAGFSKDNKFLQPQIVMGLLVTRCGFPVAWEVFKGNIFEGHTMLPILEHFADINGVSVPTVVADAAMLSEKNMVELEKKKIFYIVGARLANMNSDVIQRVSATLKRQDGSIISFPAKNGILISSFSAKRYKKDLREMEKQLSRAKRFIDYGEPGKRAKFIKKNIKGTFSLNEDLISKTESLLGIKGYVTNIPKDIMSSTDVVLHYHDLWHVEQAFKMSKSDLAARPIFHHKEDTVRAHVLLCFVALMIGKYLEITTKLSLRKIRDLIWNVTEAHIKDELSVKTITLRSSLKEVTSSPLGKLIKKWRLTY